MAHSAQLDLDHRADEPVTLHRVMQSMIGEGLRQRYAPPQKLSHELFVLLMQLKEEERKLEQQDRKRKTQLALRQMDAR